MNTRSKFFIMIMLSIIWLLFSILISINWLRDLSKIFGLTLSIIIVSGIAYIPGYICMNLLYSLILIDKNRYLSNYQEILLNHFPNFVVTILIPVHNEEKTIYKVLESINNQIYNGKITVIVIDNNSTDRTNQKVYEAIRKFNLPIKLIHESKKGKNHALNEGLKHVRTKHFITLDADTYLHKNAISFIVERMLISNLLNNVVAIAGSVLVFNDTDSIITRIQKYDYLLSINSVKRMQGLFHSTLVAQGAFSIYKTKEIKKIDGWNDCIGEDIVLTWLLLEKGFCVLFEPRAISYTCVPKTLKAFIIQRVRWARGMIEGLKHVFPLKQGNIYSKYLTSIDLVIPYIDISYLLFFLPGVILAFMGKFYIVGFLTLLVIPITVFSHFMMYHIEKREVLKPLNIHLKLYFWEYIIFILSFQSLNSFSSIIGYIQELFNFKRRWK
ncbi:glycosyltransferase family 2 protein [Mycoplasmatota bacterium]|nr:glycosyltransferase family 2 protein [Mycoplasmatota bacterium]